GRVWDGGGADGEPWTGIPRGEYCRLPRSAPIPRSHSWWRFRLRWFSPDRPGTDHAAPNASAAATSTASGSSRAAPGSSHVASNTKCPPRRKAPTCRQARWSWRAAPLRDVALFLHDGDERYSHGRARRSPGKKLSLPVKPLPVPAPLLT